MEYAQSPKLPACTLVNRALMMARALTSFKSFSQAENGFSPVVVV